MDRMRRIAGMGKAKVPSAVQKDKDESIVFFRELYKREKDRDVNLLEPMYSLEFDAIQVGGHTRKPPKGKSDFLIPVDEKHDYDWLTTPPATPLFPSLEIESSQMVFQKELPIPRSVKSSASRLSSGKPEATKTSAQSASPTIESSLRNNFIRGAPAISKEKNQPSRSIHTIAMNRQQKATMAATTTNSATKKHSERCHGGQSSSSSAVKGATNPELPFKAPKNLITTGSLFRRHAPSEKAQSKDLAFGVDVKAESGRTRRQSCPPAATRERKQLEGKQSVLPPRGKTVTGTEPASNNGGRAGEATLLKGMRTADAKKEQRWKFGGQAKK